jgi:hypothetical protein
MIETAIEWWGNAGQRSLERSALLEAAAQFTRAIDLIATLPGTPALRREQIKLQVALINALHHVKGYAAPESKTAVERARVLIEQAEALGDPPEDTLLIFTVLYGVWAASWVAFNGDVCRDLAADFLALAETQGATGPRPKRRRVLEGAWYARPRFRIGPDRQRLGRCPGNQCWTQRVAGNGSHHIYPVAPDILGESLHGSWPIP